MKLYRLSESDQFIKQVRDNGPLLGIDYGDRLVGIAKTDGNQVFANPVNVIQNPCLDYLRELDQKFNFCGIVLGFPIAMNGEEGENCAKVLKFAEKTLTPLNKPIYLQDERLSTKAARLTLINTNLSRKSKDFIDNKIAASLILESYLNFAKNR